APTEQDIRKNILETIVSEVTTLERLVQSQYDLLDKESNQGLSDISKRSEFFRRLYSLARLDDCEYTMDDAMREYVKEKLSSQANQKEVDAHYLFLTP
ncbi:MAG TPA: hypothetical protein VM260_05730, partial [Pirellula sp.]|nr:hypothetical protein [Pirellula sp.]